MLRILKSSLAVALLTVLAIPANGCAPAASDPPREQVQEAATEPALPPGHPPQDAPALPPGHPSLDSSGAIPTPPEGSGTGATGMAWTKPESWVAETPSSAMRRAQYRVSGPGGDGECVVYYFGPGQGGDARANVARWAGQFTLADGRSGTEAAEIETLDVNGVPVTLVQVAGTYSGGMTMTGRAQGGSRSNSMLLGAIAEGADANWFFKLTGPEATLREHQDAFDQMIRSLKAGE
ncbi:MAG: hypothetical protein GY856_04420 [bacterium]|nr:hypothetical protein [bacterium]